MKKRKSITNATILVMIGTIAAKFLGFFRELLIAYKYGAGNISDAFLLTNGIPSMIFVSIGTAIGINYIPFCQNLKDKKEQDKFTSNLLNITFVILLMGCILVNLFPKQILKIFATGLPDETEKYAVTMLRIVMFSIIPIIGSHLFQAYSQIKGQFHTTAWFGVITNIVIIGTTLISTEQTYYLLSVGTILANTVGMLVIIYGVKKDGYQYFRLFKPFDNYIKMLVILTLPLVVEDVASSMSLLVDRNLASFLDSGTISALSYAGTLGNIAGTMISGPVITASFPVFSKLIAENRRNEFEAEFRKYSNVICFFLCPISIAMLFHAKDIVQFIFEHGRFGNTASQIVWESMACYAIGVIPLGLQTYLIRGYYAMQDTKTPVKIKVFSLICNIVLNLAVVKKWKHAGIAMSTSISYVIAYILLSCYLQKKHQIKSVKDIGKGMVINVILSIIPGIISFLTFNFLINIDFLFAKLFLEMTLFAAIYFAVIGITNRKILITAVHIIKND